MDRLMKTGTILLLLFKIQMLKNGATLISDRFQDKTLKLKRPINKYYNVDIFGKLFVVHFINHVEKVSCNYQIVTELKNTKAQLIL